MKKLIGFVLIVCCFVSLACKAQPVSSKQDITVTYFLSSTCKICQFYSIELKAIYQEYEASGIQFRGVFPGRLESDSTVAEFGRVYGLPFSLSTDKKEEHRTLGATITPEVFVTNSKGEVLYQGRIDDAYFSVGKRRARVKHHELREALDALLKGAAVAEKFVPAVGCIIEK